MYAHGQEARRRGSSRPGRERGSTLLFLVLVLLLPVAVSAHPLDELARQWDRGSYDSPGASLQAHFDKHGREVNAADPGSYARKAEEMLRLVRGDRWQSGIVVDGYTPDVRRFFRGDRYIDIYRTRSDARLIISFGRR